MRCPVRFLSPKFLATVGLHLRKCSWGEGFSVGFSSSQTCHFAASSWRKNAVEGPDRQIHRNQLYWVISEYKSDRCWKIRSKMYQWRLSSKWRTLHFLNKAHKKVTKNISARLTIQVKSRPGTGNSSFEKQLSAKPAEARSSSVGWWNWRRVFCERSMIRTMSWASVSYTGTALDVYADGTARPSSYEWIRRVAYKYGKSSSSQPWKTRQIQR